MTLGVGSGEKASVVGVGSNEKKIRFWGFPKRQRSVSLELVTFGSAAPAAMLSSGCGALELRERKNERADGGAVRESNRDGERLLILLKGKKVFRQGLKIFKCIFVFLGV